MIDLLRPDACTGPVVGMNAVDSEVIEVVERLFGERGSDYWLPPPAAWVVAESHRQSNADLQVHFSAESTVESINRSRPTGGVYRLRAVLPIGEPRYHHSILRARDEALCGAADLLVVRTDESVGDFDPAWYMLRLALTMAMPVVWLNRCAGAAVEIRLSNLKADGVFSENLSRLRADDGARNWSHQAAKVFDPALPIGVSADDPWAAWTNSRLKPLFDARSAQSLESRGVVSDARARGAGTSHAVLHAAQIGPAETIRRFVEAQLPRPGWVWYWTGLSGVFHRLLSSTVAYSFDNWRSSGERASYGASGLCVTPVHLQQTARGWAS